MHRPYFYYPTWNTNLQGHCNGRTTHFVNLFRR